MFPLSSLVETLAFSIIVLGSGAFGRCLGLDEVVGVECCDGVSDLIGKKIEEIQELPPSWPCGDTVRGQPSGSHIESHWELNVRSPESCLSIR